MMSLGFAMYTSLGGLAGRLSLAAGVIGALKRQLPAAGGCVAVVPSVALSGFDVVFEVLLDRKGNAVYDGTDDHLNREEPVVQLECVVGFVGVDPRVAEDGQDDGLPEAHEDDELDAKELEHGPDWSQLVRDRDV
ncbi:hypothetical protein OIY81_3157 [Cryptosporidium canis]|uniref:Uncharacterized protein n=1 Tax=Cryptosporidium canis TaxID=195482 RepID=A0ABQ8P4Z5_9CRYT|nr:hypothetical protein OJ252_3366 [Cryptosporidium canis]KAJ1606595.1 hypothetical protein OIY81_3157 [Cryptosporidium canis]